jgi:hypothetical protein
MDWLGRSRSQLPRQGEDVLEPDRQSPAPPPSLQVSTIEVELFSDTYSIHGFLVTRHHRLTDVLLETFLPSMRMRDATVRSWYDTSASPYALDIIHINKAAVVCAVPAGAPQSPSPSQDQSAMLVRKVPHRILLSAPPYEIRGEIHLVPDSDPGEVLDVIQDAFIPVTNADVVFLPKADTRFAAKVVVVNRTRVQFMASETPKHTPPGAAI